MCEKNLQLLLINDNLFAPSCKHSVIYIVYINPQQEFPYCCVHWTRTEEKLKQFYKGWLGIQLPWQLLLIDCSLLLFIRRETVGERREKRRQGEVEGRKKRRSRERDGDGDKQEGWFSNIKKGGSENMWDESLWFSNRRGYDVKHGGCARSTSLWSLLLFSQSTPGLLISVGTGYITQLISVRESCV